jgi:hypothetical protein
MQNRVNCNFKAAMIQNYLLRKKEIKPSLKFVPTIKKQKLHQKNKTALFLSFIVWKIIAQKTYQEGV